MFHSQFSADMITLGEPMRIPSELVSGARTYISTISSFRSHKAERQLFLISGTLPASFGGFTSDYDSEAEDSWEREGPIFSYKKAETAVY